MAEDKLPDGGPVEPPGDAPVTPAESTDGAVGSDSDPSAGDGAAEGGPAGGAAGPGSDVASANGPAGDASGEEAATEQQPASESEEGASAGKPLGLKIGIGAIAVIGVAYLVAVLSTAGGIPDNTVVAGVAIGGKSESAAAATLEQELAEQAAAPMTVTALAVEASFDPAGAGMAPDYRTTADVASGPIFNPVRLVQHLTGQTVEVAPIIRVDDDLMAKELQRIAEEADDPAAEPEITMDAEQPTITPGEDGEGIDRQASRDDIVASYLFTQGPLALPVTFLEPTVSDEEAQRVVEEYAQPAVSGPVSLSFDGSSEDLTVDTIVEALSFAAEDGTLEPQVNVELLRAGLPVLAETEDPGTDATWDVSSGKPVVVPSKQGRGVTDEELTTQVLAALPKTGAADRTATLEIESTDPSLTTEQATALNVTEQLSSFTQKFDYAEYRRVNVGQAAEYLNGTVLKPGDEFSMNGTIKERTVANGYTSGTFISGGRFQEGLGGGVSIATTATWTAAFFAGMEAIEVNPHSLYISRYQPGLEATVAWGLLDLRFRNDTDDGVLITSSAGDTFHTVTFWGTKKYDRISDVSSDRYNITKFSTKYDTSSSCSAQGGSNGFTIDVWRVFENGGREVEREKFTTRYDPTTRYVCSPPPAPQPSPSPSTGGDGNAPSAPSE